MKTLYATLVLVSAIAWIGAQPAPPGTAPAPADGAKKATNAPAVNTNAAPAGTNDAPAPPIVTPQATNAPATADPGAKPTNAPTLTPTPAPGPGATPSAPARSFPAFPPPPTFPPRTPGVPAGAGAKPPTNALAAKAVAAGTNMAAKLDEEILPPGLIKFQDMDLVNVLDVYQELTGRTVMRPTTLPATKINIKSQTSLTRKEAIQALDSILSLNGITMIPQGEKFVKAVQQQQAPQEAARFHSGTSSDLPEAGQYVVQIVHLTNALPKDVAQVLQQFAKSQTSIIGIDAAGILILRDYAENVKRMLDVIEQIDVVPKDEYEPVIIPIKYALAGDIAQVLSGLTAGGGGVIQVGTSRPSTGLSAGGFGGGGGYGGRGGIGGAGGYGGYGGYGAQGLQGQAGYNPNTSGLGGTTGLGGVGGAGATGARGSFQDRLRSIVGRATGTGEIVVLGQTKIIADERTNSLLIFASKQDMVSISNIISKLDVVLAQVLIEALIMEVSLSDTLDYGISYLQRSVTKGGNYFNGIGGIKNGPFLSPGSFGSLATNAAGGLASGFSYYARFGDNFEATATAAATDSRINVLSRPRVQTSHAVECNIFIGETRPYITGTYSYLGSGPSSQYSQLQIGITLSVLPLVNADGLVSMDIRQKIQSIGGTVKIDNNDLPATIDREVNSKVAVRDRETVILGGFISTEKRKAASGVPILKDIPILGNLFRSTSKSNDRKEIMVLIRPTVLPTPREAALTAIEEKSKLPGITAAELERSEDERKLLQKSNKEIYKKEGFSN